MADVDAVDVVTDPDVLRLYVDRILLDRDPVRTQAALSPALLSLYDEARGREPLQGWAQKALTRFGEQAAPMRDEGVPCG